MWLVRPKNSLWSGDTRVLPKDQGNVCKLCQQEWSWRPFFWGGEGRCASGGFPRTWFTNKLWEILWNIEKVKKSDSKQTSGKIAFQSFVFPWQRPPAHGQLHSRALGSFWMGGVWSSAVQSGSCAERLPLVSKHENWLATQRFDDEADLQAGVNEWLKSQAATFYDDGINKLVHRYDKCLNLNGDYVEI